MHPHAGLTSYPRAQAEIGRDDLPNGKAREVTVEVRDEHGQQVFTATVYMTMRRVARALA
jgi:hypothetical protein